MEVIDKTYLGDCTQNADQILIIFTKCHLDKTYRKHFQWKKKTFQIEKRSLDTAKDLFPILRMMQVQWHVGLTRRKARLDIQSLRLSICSLPCYLFTIQVQNYRFGNRQLKFKLERPITALVPQVYSVQKRKNLDGISEITFFFLAKEIPSQVGNV